MKALNKLPDESEDLNSVPAVVSSAMSSNAAALYAQISSNPEQTQALFRQALQDPSGAMESICGLGKATRATRYPRRRANTSGKP
jgi:hypothetical protein